MGYQFIHIESYARVGSRQKVKAKGYKLEKQIRKWSAAEIAAEAEREPDACPHVMEPKPPVVLYGGMPSDAVKRAEAWGAQATDLQGRKLRKDGMCMLAGVVSLPEERSEDWPLYREAVVAELKKQHGQRLVSVVEHTDEKHPHLHFYAVPLDGERFDVLHPGRLAASKKAQQGAKKGAQNDAYKVAMRGYQDDFANAVAARFGLARMGPGRRRLTRKAWQAEKTQAQALAALAIPHNMGMRPEDAIKQVVEKRTLLPDVLESDEERANRLNALMQKRTQPLLAAAKNAAQAMEQSTRLVKTTDDQAKQIKQLQAKRDELESLVELFTPAELEAARERRAKALEEQAKAEKAAVLAAEKARRIEAIPALVRNAVGTALTFLQHAIEYLKEPEQTDKGWGRVEGAAIKEAMSQNGQEPKDVCRAICELSPLRITETSHRAVSDFIDKHGPAYQAEFETKRNGPDYGVTSVPR